MPINPYFHKEKCDRNTKKTNQKKCVSLINKIITIEDHLRKRSHLNLHQKFHGKLRKGNKCKQKFSKNSGRRSNKWTKSERMKQANIHEEPQGKEDEQVVQRMSNNFSRGYDGPPDQTQIKAHLTFIRHIKDILNLSFYT